MLTHHYRYDPLNRLTHSANTQRFYHHSRMTTEIQGTVRYSVFQSGDTVLAQTRADGEASECSLLASGMQRSVLQVVSPDGSRSAAYSPYGHSCEPPVLGFNGERADPVTGHYLLGNGYRAFNPVLMRFNSADSWSPFGRGGINGYGYCEGDPVNRVDPSGHFWRRLIRAVTGLAGKRSAAKPIALVAPPLTPIALAAPPLTLAKWGYEALEDFRQLIPGIYVARQQDEFGKYTTQLVAGHGAIYTTRGGISFGYMLSGDRPLGAPMLSKLLSKKVSFKGIKEINLVMCHSADLKEASFAQYLANDMGLPVTGYLNKPCRIEPEFIAEHVPRIEPWPRRVLLKDGFVFDQARIIREGVQGGSYDPVRFLPSPRNGS